MMKEVDTKKVAELIRSCSVWNADVLTTHEKIKHTILPFAEMKKEYEEAYTKMLSAMEWHDKAARELNEILGENAVCIYLEEK